MFHKGYKWADKNHQTLKGDFKMDFDEMLIKKYGNQIKPDLDIIKKKFGAVIAAHCYAGFIGDNPLVKLNRVLQECLEK